MGAISPPLQESCDPSSFIVGSDLHFSLTRFIIEFMHIDLWKNVGHIVIHSLDKKNFAFDYRNAIKMSFLACRQVKFLS